MDLSRATDQLPRRKLSERSGHELCRWSRSRSDVPIVMLTALGDKASDRRP
jgi:DNA-binding response OmpR family regulator